MNRLVLRDFVGSSYHDATTSGSSISAVKAIVIREDVDFDSQDSVIQITSKHLL